MTMNNYEQATQEVRDAFNALCKGRVKAAVEAEREAIISEWSMCIQSDLEHGVKCLNEQAAKNFTQNYPEIAKFGAWLSSRGDT